MVTARDTTNFATLIRIRFDNIIKKLGRTDFTVYSIATTFKQSGKILTTTETSTANVKGSLQFGTVVDKQLLEMGWVKEGDGIFFTAHATTISENNEIAEGTVTTRWILTRQIEGENVDGNRTYQAWIATRKEI